MKAFDFTMIHEETSNYESLSKDMIRRFNHVNSYKELILKYNDLINEYMKK